MINKIDFIEKENFKPFLLPESKSALSKIFLFFRLLIDTPHRSLISKFKLYSKNISGEVLDVGAGKGFYKRYFNNSVNYTGLEVEETYKHFRNQNKNLVFYDGKKFPFKNSSYDNIICFEVLEHTFDYENLLNEISRVLKKDGLLFLSVPFAAKFHQIPWDFFRFTPSALKILIEKNKLNIVSFQRRGGDLAVVFHYIIVAILGMIFVKKPISFIIGICLLPLGLFCGILSNICEYFDLGAPENTLGYFVVCRKIKN